jgi:hypothetical protein
LPGLGVRLLEISVPVPDLLIRPNDGLKDSECADMMVAFEGAFSVDSKSRPALEAPGLCGAMPSLSQHVVVAQDALEVVSYDRKTGFAERRFGRS